MLVFATNSSYRAVPYFSSNGISNTTQNANTTAAMPKLIYWKIDDIVFPESVVWNASISRKILMIKAIVRFRFLA